MIHWTCTVNTTTRWTVTSLQLKPVYLKNQELLHHGGHGLEIYHRSMSPEGKNVQSAINTKHWTLEHSTLHTRKRTSNLGSPCRGLTRKLITSISRSREQPIMIQGYLTFTTKTKNQYPTILAGGPHQKTFNFLITLLHTMQKGEKMVI